MSETQATITAWGRETFGTCSALEICARMGMELAELMEVLASGTEDRTLSMQLTILRQVTRHLNGTVNRLVQAGEDLACADVPRAVEECADIDIMLVQVASALEANLGEARDRKMAVNRRRVWRAEADGTMQHVETEA